MSYKNQFKELVEKLIEIKFSDTPKKTTFLDGYSRRNFDEY